MSATLTPALREELEGGSGVTMLTQGDGHFARRLILYDEDATLGPRIAAGVEDDPRWELIALCATLDDLSFALNRVTVDVLLLHLTPESSGRVLGVASGLARDAPLLVLFQSGVRRQCRAPSDLLVADRGFPFLWGGGEGESWALLPLVPPAGPPRRTAQDIMGAEAYRWFDRLESSNENSQYNTLA